MDEQRIKDGGGEEEDGAVEREHIKGCDLGVADKSKILTCVKETTPLENVLFFFWNCDADIFDQNIQMPPSVEMAGFPGSFTSSLFV